MAREIFVCRLNTYNHDLLAQHKVGDVIIYLFIHTFIHTFINLFLNAVLIYLVYCWSNMFLGGLQWEFDSKCLSKPPGPLYSHNLVLHTWDLLYYGIMWEPCKNENYLLTYVFWKNPLTHTQFWPRKPRWKLAHSHIWPIFIYFVQIY